MLQKQFDLSLSTLFFSLHANNSEISVAQTEREGGGGQRDRDRQTEKVESTYSTTNFPAADLSVTHSGFKIKISSLFLELQGLFQLSPQQHDTPLYTGPDEYTPYSKTIYLQHIATVGLTSHLRLGLPNFSSF
jgi:hypothetical protein